MASSIKQATSQAPAQASLLAKVGGPDTDRIVQSALSDISHIATLPEVTLKIIRLVEDPDSTATDLNSIITNDPALGARILKVVNSAFYGLPGQIGSINRAIVLLGLNAVKNIAIAASLAKLFRGGKICPGFDARDLWTHCVAVATTTRLLADRIGLGLPDEAFLAGLIHDLGIMVEIQARRAQFVEVLTKMQGSTLTLRQAETAVMGVSHEQFGAGLCKAWKFPTSFAYVTGYHHRPLELPEPNRTLTSLVYVADVIAANQSLGFGASVEVAEPSPEVMDQLKITDHHVADVIEKIPQAVNEAQALLQESPG